MDFITILSYPCIKTFCFSSLLSPVFLTNWLLTSTAVPPCLVPFIPPNSFHFWSCHVYSIALFFTFSCKNEKFGLQWLAVQPRQKVLSVLEEIIELNIKITRWIRQFREVKGCISAYSSRLHFIIVGKLKKVLQRVTPHSQSRSERTECIIAHLVGCLLVPSAISPCLYTSGPSSQETVSPKVGWVFN